MATKTAAKSNPTFAAAVARVQPALAGWRQQRKHREPIPEALWREIVPLARAHGLSPVTQALPLNYTSLKRHVLASPSPTAPPQVAGTGFVEVSVAPWAVSSQWVIQLEDRIGSKLTLRLAAGGSAEALARAQGLWRYRYFGCVRSGFPRGDLAGGPAAASRPPWVWRCIS